LQLQKLPPLLKHLKKDHPITLVFIEANEDALLRRYSETRRPHPLGKNFSVRESLSHERALLEPIRKLADVVIETTQFNVHELRNFVTERFKNPDKRPMLVSVVSSGIATGCRRMRTWFSTCDFCPIRISCRACGLSQARTRKCGGISARFRRPGNSCAASKAC